MIKNLNKIAALIFAGVLLFSNAVVVFATEDSSQKKSGEQIFDIANGNIVINGSEVTVGTAEPVDVGNDKIVVTGTSADNNIIMSGNTKIVLRDLTLSADEEKSLIDLQNGTVELVLEGSNNLSNPTGQEQALIHVSSETELIVSGDGALDIQFGSHEADKQAYGAAIGGDYKEAPKAITFNSGNIAITMDGTSAAIGGGARADSGKIKIVDGHIAVEVYGTGTAGTGIGGGAEGYHGVNEIGTAGSADISITGGRITALVKPDDVSESGAAIGSGQNKGGNIYIGGNAVVDAETWVQSAAIGGGSGVAGSHGGQMSPSQDDPGNIIIEGEAQVQAQTVAVDVGEPYCSGAGIGAGGFNHQEWSILIQGNANVTAKNGAYGAGIGGAVEFVNSLPVSVVITENAVVDASSDWFGTGIGTGRGQVPTAGSTVTISGNATVTAAGGKSGYDLDGGAAIGAGADANISSILIMDQADVYAIAGTDASAIGGAVSSEIVGDIKISSDAEIEAYADGTLYAIDTRGNVEGVQNSILNARFDKTANPADAEKDFIIELDGNEDRAMQMPANYRSFASTVSIEDDSDHILYVKGIMDCANEYANYPDEHGNRFIQYDVKKNEMLNKDELNWVKLFGVTYQFRSQTENQQLPDEVMKLLPKDTEKYLSGSVVSVIDPTEKSVAVRGGKWIFVGWDEENKTITEDVVFTGTWKFEPNKATEPTKPDADKGNDAPTAVKTGDTAGILLWRMSILLSCAGIAGILLMKHKKR